MQRQPWKPASNRITGTILLVMLLALAACGPAAAPAAPPAPTAPPATDATAPTVAAATAPAEEAPTEQAPAEEPTAAPEAETAPQTTAATTDGCPTAQAGATAVVNTAAGYCFLIPPGYTTGYDLVIYAPAGTEGHRERAIVEVTPAQGRTAAQIADALDAELTGFEIARSTVDIDGNPAEILDGMPGQDINRRVIVVANARAYNLMFMPIAPQEDPAATAQAEELYAQVMDSLHFLTPEAAPSITESDPILTWQGEIDGACHTLSVWAEGIAQAGVCGDAPSVTAQLLSPAIEWAAIQTHFGALDQIATPHGTITFTGTGSATGDLWATALATWAEFAAMETLSGRPSAAGRTTLAWQMGEIDGQPGRCAQLIVLAYGWAYANQIPCEGNGPGTQVGQGWLTDAELATFTTWMNDHSRVDAPAGYLDATGSAPLTAEAIAPFAADLYARLLTASGN